ncbi:hypothetical protein Tco_0020817, partial [Tanacetum coccineum]
MVSMWKAKVISRPSLLSGSPLRDTAVPSAEILVTHVLPAPSIVIATAPPACDTLTPVITASPAICSRIRTTARKSALGLRPVMMLARSAALCRARRVALSPETSSSSSSSDSASHASESSFTASLQDDLLPPYKRYRGTSVAHSHKSSDDGSPKTHAESDMDSDIQADIEAETATAASTVAAIVDGGVDTGFEPGLVVVKSESKPKEVEADDEADAEIQPKGTIEIGVDVTTGIDIPNDLLIPDIIERLEQLEESVQGQTDQQARNMIADGERSSLLERVAALEGSNTRLRDAL